jgi:hypothetical protein
MLDFLKNKKKITNIMENQESIQDSNSSIVPGCNNDFNSILSVLTDSPARKNIDPQIVATLYQQGFSSVQISKALKISRNTVFYHLNNIKDESEIDRFFVKKRAEVFQNVQRRLLTSISEDDIKKTPVGSRVLAVAQLYDKERLETDQSTQNQALIIGVDPKLRGILSSASSKHRRISHNTEVQNDTDL